jgi:Protein of unknown function (DUF3047)
MTGRSRRAALSWSLGAGLGVLLAVRPIAAAPAGQSGPADSAACRRVADFSRDQPGEFPADWKPKDDTARRVYRVLEEGGLRFVRATAEGTGSQMGREFPWDLKTHPVLAWRWRPRAFPAGSDERESSRNDSALGVYAVFPHSPMTVKTVKYLWSREVSVGTTASASAGLTRMIVRRSGPAADGGWVAEAVDVAADYRRLFGEDPPAPQGIAVLTDADQTRSRAEGDYADFRVCPAGVRS